MDSFMFMTDMQGISYDINFLALVLSREVISTFPIFLPLCTLRLQMDLCNAKKDV